MRLRSSLRPNSFVNNYILPDAGSLSADVGSLSGSVALNKDDTLVMLFKSIMIQIKYKNIFEKKLA